MKNKQLFCLTHAGGIAGFFNEIENDLQEYNVVKLEYAGHGARYKEPFYGNFDDLASDMYSIIRESYSGREYAILGYSMGSISLIEVLRRILCDLEFPNPRCVFLAAHEPHAKVELPNYSSNEADEYVKQRTIDFGAVPKVLFNNKAFWRLYLPIYRADYSLLEKYRFEELTFETDIPVTIFYSAEDTPTEDMLRWKRIFIGECDFYRYMGTHFFIKEHHKEMAEVICKKFDERCSNDI